MSDKALLNKLFKENNLVKDVDTFSHKHYTILTRSGIEKVQAMHDITVTFDFIESGVAGVVIKAYAKKGDKLIETFGSASKETSQSKYYVEMAEKRALSRAVLKMSGLYAYGFFSQDESDDFKPPK